MPAVRSETWFCSPGIVECMKDGKVVYMPALYLPNKYRRSTGPAPIGEVAYTDWAEASRVAGATATRVTSAILAALAELSIQFEE